MRTKTPEELTQDLSMTITRLSEVEGALDEKLGNVHKELLKSMTQDLTLTNKRVDQVETLMDAKLRDVHRSLQKTVDGLAARIEGVRMDLVKAQAAMRASANPEATPSYEPVDVEDSVKEEREKFLKSVRTGNVQKSAICRRLRAAWTTTDALEASLKAVLIVRPASADDSLVAFKAYVGGNLADNNSVLVDLRARAEEKGLRVDYCPLVPLRDRAAAIARTFTGPHTATPSEIRIPVTPFAGRLLALGAQAYLLTPSAKISTLLGNSAFEDFVWIDTQLASRLASQDPGMFPCQLVVSGDTDEDRTLITVEAAPATARSQARMVVGTWNEFCETLATSLGKQT